MKRGWLVEAIGWVATAVFSSSYFFRRPGVLRSVQAGAAVLWIIYGAAIHAVPVVAANALVAAAALFSLARQRS
jgi:hypothetical protein